MIKKIFILTTIITLSLSANIKESDLINFQTKEIKECNIDTYDIYKYLIDNNYIAISNISSYAGIMTAIFERCPKDTKGFIDKIKEDNLSYTNKKPIMIALSASKTNGLLNDLIDIKEETFNKINKLFIEKEIYTSENISFLFAYYLKTRNNEILIKLITHYDSENISLINQTIENLFISEMIKDKIFREKVISSAKRLEKYKDISKIERKVKDYFETKEYNNLNLKDF